MSPRDNGGESGGSQSGEATWQLVLSSARVLLERGRPADVSLRKIADHAGVALSTVQYYFPSKDALLETLLDAYYARLMRVTHSCVDLRTSMDRDAWIRHTVRTHYRFSLEERPSLWLRLHLAVSSGRLPLRREEEIRVPAMRAANEVMQAAVPPDALHLRLMMQTMAFVVPQFALLQDDELLSMTEQTTIEAAQTAVEEHLVRLVMDFIHGLPPA